MPWRERLQNLVVEWEYSQISCTSRSLFSQQKCSGFGSLATASVE